MNNNDQDVFSNPAILALLSQSYGSKPSEDSVRTANVESEPLKRETSAKRHRSAKGGFSFRFNTKMGGGFSVGSSGKKEKEPPKAPPVYVFSEVSLSPEAFRAGLLTAGKREALDENNAPIRLTNGTIRIILDPTARIADERSLMVSFWSSLADHSRIGGYCDSEPHGIQLDSASFRAKAMINNAARKANNVPIALPVHSVERHNAETAGRGFSFGAPDHAQKFLDDLRAKERLAVQEESILAYLTVTNANDPTYEREMLKLAASHPEAHAVLVANPTWLQSLHVIASGRLEQIRNEVNSFDPLNPIIRDTMMDRYAGRNAPNDKGLC